MYFVYDSSLPDISCDFRSLCFRCIPVTLVLKDPQHPDQDLGSLDLSVTLTPKDSPVEERRDSTSTVRTPTITLDSFVLTSRDYLYK